MKTYYSGSFENVKPECNIENEKSISPILKRIMIRYKVKLVRVFEWCNDDDLS